MALAGAGPALAHPHIFVDASFEVTFDAEGRATGLRTLWTYDDLISLQLLTDRGMDEDFDGILTADELATLSGFDMAWEPGFAGDTYALSGAAALALSPPSDWTVCYADARLTSTHYRSFDAPVDVSVQPLVIQSYDPGYYTAYSVIDATIADRQDCTVEIMAPDREAADQILADAITEMAGGGDAEGDFPAIGSAYAEEARVTCAAP
jgi:polyphosphate kinase